jgi:hypothetical protein
MHQADVCIARTVKCYEPARHLCVRIRNDVQSVAEDRDDQIRESTEDQAAVSC